MARIKLRYVCSNSDRHGNVRYYFNKRGQPCRIRLPGLPGSAEFMAAYAAALGGKSTVTVARAKAKPSAAAARGQESLEWLCNRYSKAVFSGFAENTRRNKQSIFGLICAETVGGTGPTVGSLPYAELQPKHVRMLRDRKADTPSTADAYIKQLSALFKWAIENDLATVNPARDVPRQRGKSEGFHTWTMDEVARFEAAHPIGTQARLALALHMFTGQRKSDGIALGPHNRTPDGRLVFTQKKNETRDPVHMDIPLLPDLAAILDATPHGASRYLVNDKGEPWTIAGFGNKFRDWCNAAGLPHCTVHGLRKAAACLAAENGATEMQMMSIFGWKDPEQARVYTRQARRAKMAGDSMHLITKRARAA